MRRVGEAREDELLRLWQEKDDFDALDALLRGELELLKQRLRSRSAPGEPRPPTRDDVAQQAVLRVLAASPPPRFPTAAALRGYLWTAARNLLIDRLRRANKSPHEIGPAAAGSFHAEPATKGSLDRIERQDMAQALELALNLLRPPDQEVLRLVYFQELSIEDAASRLGVTRDVANTRLVRARMRLAEKLESWREFLSG